MTSQNNSSTLPTPASLVCEFHKKLKNDRAAQEIGRVASRIKIETSETVRGYALCCLSKTEETSEYYRDLDNFELFDMQKSAEIIKGDIDVHVEKDTGLGTMITEASKLLNDLKVKLHDANDAACAMRNCLQSHLGFKEHEVPAELTDVAKLAKSVSTDGQKAAEAIVKVAGIHTFSNLETLQPFGADLTEKVTALKAWTDSLVATAKTDEEKAQAELTEVLQELNAEEFEYFRTTGVVNAHDCTLEYICEGQCQPIECVEEICKEMGKCVSEAEEPPQGQFTKGDED